MGGGTSLRDGSRDLGVFGKISGRLPGRRGRAGSLIPFVEGVALAASAAYFLGMKSSMGAEQPPGCMTFTVSGDA